MPMRPDQLDALRALLRERRVLSLAVMAEGEPIVGLLPFACSRDGRALIVHASKLARHTRGLVADAPFDALIHDLDVAEADPMQIRRVTLRGRVQITEDPESRATFLARFPAAEPITHLGDFSFFRLEIASGRLVTGFGGAVNVTQDSLDALSGATPRP
jgi:putative heme iron utilization protein